MTSFFAKARERAEAAAQQLQAHHAASSAGQAGDASVSSDAANPSGSTSGSGFTYKGSMPHLFRQGLASVDPRYESTRQFHLLSQAIKGFNIDHEAAGREAKSLAKATFVWGQHHLPEKRDDSGGDEMLVDVADRLAYVWHEIGQLETAHGQRSEQARSRLKRFEKAEMELGQRRANRSKLKKELHALMPERAIAAGSARIQEAEARLRDLISDDQADEEYLSRVKRESVQDGYAAMFDSLIELGEKMALVARYGKLLTTTISTEKSPFPATVKPRGESIPLWEGASKTAEVRAALASALSTFKPDLSLPDLPAESALSATTSLGRADTVSYAVSHKSELQDEQVPSATPISQRRPSISSERSDLLQPGTAATQTSSSGSSQKLNLSPTALPAPLLPPRPQRSPSATTVDTLRSPTTNPFADPAALPAVAGGSAAQDEEPLSPPGPPGPTVAETGVVPTGPGGPKSGTLRPRRSSASQRSASISAGAVAYLGPTGTYSHQAALKVFGEAGTNLIPMQSITGAIDFVRRGTPGNAKIAIVPVENSTFGPVRETFDKFLGISNGDRHAFKPADGAQLHIVGEACLSVDHALLCGPKTYHHLLQLQGDTDPNASIRDDTLSNITNVISHEQALGQCSHYLTRYLPQAKKKAVESTAAAAVTALEFEAGTAPGRSSASVDHAHESLGFSSNSLVAAVGAEAAVTTIGVRVLRSKIQDVKDNRTRFLILASEPLEGLLAVNALPPSITQLYSLPSPAGKTGRSLLSVSDALTSDLTAEAGSYSGQASTLDRVVSQLQRLEAVSMRKMDRRPASMVDAPVAGSSVWRSNYLIELQYPADHASVAEGSIRQVVAELSSGPIATSSVGSSAPVSYLGSWLVDATTLSGGAASSVAAGKATQVLPASGSGLPTTTLPASFNLSEREPKELEAQREAAEVQRHAEQARLSRQQQQAELYGVEAQPSASVAGGSGTQRLSGLQEVEGEQRLTEEEGLPAYQPLDPRS
ncbi:Eisosome component PIL1/LSP1 [Kalmanozyma brasiliensis GHG001]|uniref:Eisosome component PIL1/LSP1 n=1 Tax=Kalmanozyma brasiliensis (strain GHG001) TaxID=1365824 RepID=UPI002867EC15|nr:Eisosome component PIL1/LSP1 [Kalmanozyma brasiliensis GHG001]EST10073.2 Eisosome component PIL1/LSP1 [Kalmanozyma brasiliensis GHG001]